MKTFAFWSLVLMLVGFASAACGGSAAPPTTGEQAAASAAIPAVAVPTPSPVVRIAPAFPSEKTSGPRGVRFEDPRIYEVPGEQAVPMGITYDPVTNKFFVGSARTGEIFRGDPATGEVDVYADSGDDIRSNFIGLAVDATHRRLWVVGQSRKILAFNVDTGEILRQIDAPVDSNISDVAVAPSGDVYIADFGGKPHPASSIYRITNSGEAGELELWMSVSISMGRRFFKLVVSEDGKYLITDNTSTRLFRIGIEDKEMVQIDLDGTIGGPGTAIEGMALDGRDLFVAGYDISGSGHVNWIKLSADYLSGEVQGVLIDPSFATPRTIAQVGDRLLVANSQLGWGAGGPLGVTPRPPFTVSDVLIPSVDVER